VTRRERIFAAMIPLPRAASIACRRGQSHGDVLTTPSRPAEATRVDQRAAGYRKVWRRAAAIRAGQWHP
jgi:hypothetical protein